MLLGRCCKCNEVKVVTIKGLTASTGVTEWEYGPGSLWAQHYGADRVSGIQNDSDAVLNRYCEIAYRQFTFTSNGPYRTSGAITANCKEALTLVKLDSTDGTVVESATMQGLFTYNPSGVVGASYQLYNVRMFSPVGLSGGDYAFIGHIDPAIEWVDYTNNTTNKEYVFHAHTLSGGNVYLRTKTSSEIVTLPYNATAAEVKGLLQATANVVSATVTGGPWPMAKMNVDIVWSVSTGDFAGQRSDVSYATGGDGSCTWRWDATALAWVLVSDNCALGGAMAPMGTGTFDGEIREGTCPVPETPLPTGTRQSQAVAVVFSTSTGAMTSFAEARFGLVNGSFATRLISDGGASVQGTTEIANNAFAEWAAGPENSVIVIGAFGSAGVTPADARTVEAWTVASTWARIWQRYANGETTSRGYAWLSTQMVQSGKIAVNVARTLYSGANKTGTVADITAGTFTSFDESEVSTESTFSNFVAESVLLDGSTSDRLTYAYNRRFTAPNFSSRIIDFNLGGSQYRTSAKRLLLGIEDVTFGADSSRIYGSRLYSGGTTSSMAAERPNRVTSPPESSGASYAGSISRTYRWRFYTAPGERYTSGDWRIVFGSVLSQLRTGWISWLCSSSDIINAVLAVFPENTEGVVSNVRVNPFGASSVADNSPAIGLLEANLDIHFQAASTLGFISTTYASQVAIETRSLSSAGTGGIVSLSATDAAVSWSRNWGTTASPARTYIYPSGGWLRGSRLILFGPVVDDEP
jgi:hypothetical protein